MMALERLKDCFKRHDRVALFFSGGKDSLATLLLAEEYWGKVAVVWVDTGAQLPEIHDIVAKFKKAIPNFFIVRSNQPENIRTYGYPVDVLPVWSTLTGQSIGGMRPLKLQSWLDCCAENIWKPGYEFSKALEVTAIIRGQRQDERYTAPTRSGEVFEGVELVYPIEEWTKDEVLEYLEEKGYKNERLDLSHSSLDCWNCTAFVPETGDRLRYLRKNHPEKAAKIFPIFQAIVAETKRDLNLVSAGIEELR